MRVVLDTNVLVSGIFWRGTPYQIVVAWTKGGFELAVTTKILAEYLAVITRMDPERAIVEHWSRYITENAFMVADTTIVGVSRDPTDDMFINAATGSRSDYLVSGDDDLLSLQKQSPVPIISPRSLMTLLRKH